MSIADNQTTTPAPNSFAERRPAAKILQFKEKLQEKTGAMGEWARLRADDAHQVMERRPLATAGISAATAFVGGLALGLLLSGRIGALAQPPARSGLASRLGSQMKSRFRM
jgi:hypothetical protein